MIEPTVEIPHHLIYFYNLTKNYESTFGKKAKSLGVNTNEILILIEIYHNEGINQIDITITEKGQDLCEELLVIFRDWNNKIITGIPEENLIMFGETL